MPRDKTLFEEREFKGSLGVHEHSVPIAFKARLDVTGALLLDLEPLPLTKDTRFIMDVWHETKRAPALFRLSGSSDDGIRLETQSLYFNSIGPHSSADRGAYYAFKAQLGGAKLHRPCPARERPFLRLWLRGFRCFPQVRASCDLGQIGARGDVRDKTANSLLGHIDLLATDAPENAMIWRRDAECMVQHVRRVMSFAAGINLGDPVLEFHFGDNIEIDVVARTPQPDEGSATIHKLDRQTIFDAAVRSFRTPRYPAENLWMAMEWFAMSASYKEARLITVMTALENLVASNTRDIAELLPKKQLKMLTTLLKPVIEQVVSDSGLSHSQPDLVGQLTEKLQELRRRAFKRKLDALIDRWSMPMDGITPEMIGAAISARNDIIHEGRYYVDGRTRSDLYEHIRVVREIVTRLIFCAIGFEGRYTSQLGGYHDAVFPPPP